MLHKSLHIILLSAILLISQSTFSQEVSNLRVRQEGVDIVIQYDLSCDADIAIFYEYYNNNKRHNFIIRENDREGDIGKNVSSGNDKRAVWHVLDDLKLDEVMLENCFFRINAEPPYKTFLLALGGYSFSPQQPSGGFMVGGVKHIGWYAKARTNFIFKNADGGQITNNSGNYDITNIGTINEEIMPYFLTGKSRNSHWIANAGVVVRLFAHQHQVLCWYGGAGYGAREHQLLAYNNKWYTYSPSTFRGVSADTGLLYSAGKFALSICVSTIKFKYLETEIGLGVSL